MAARPNTLQAARLLALGATVLLAGCDAVAALDPPAPRPASVDVRKVVGEGSSPRYFESVRAAAGDAVQVRIEAIEGDTLEVEVADGPRARAEVSARLNGGAASTVFVRSGSGAPIAFGRPIELTPGDLEVIPSAAPQVRRYELTIPQVYGQEKSRTPVTFKLKIR